MEKEQHDKFLDGSKDLPQDVHILKFVSARANEIALMTRSIENPKQTKLIFQKLPVHMRRRIMSHNVKRMPRRLREAHLRQMAKSGLPPNNKRPSRKYRRRPHNLLLEYNRRQRDKIWLETHIWHAKRFHMIEKWGYKIANYSNDKCFRANYRAIANHCSIHDISYYCCVEISGPVDFLYETLDKHCNPNELTFRARVYLNGNREGTLTFFKKDGYPRFPIGVVHFIWKSNDSNLKTILIWVHPSVYADFLFEIVSNFEFKLIRSSEENCTTDKLKVVPTYSNDKNCSMVLLKDRLNRFRLRGPLTPKILTDTLRLPNLDLALKETNLQSNSESSENIETSKLTTVNAYDVKIKNEDEIGTIADIEKSEPTDSTKMDVDSEVHDQSSCKSWFVNYYGNQYNAEAFKVQRDLFANLKTLQSPSQLPPNIVIALTVLDPRFYVPPKRTKSHTGENLCKMIGLPPTLASHGPIWESDVRHSVTMNFVKTTEIYKLRSKNLVPGISNDENYNENIISKIPILLIQKPGCYDSQKSIGFSSSIDIVVPTGWSMPFWLAFILRCAKPAGLREAKSVVLESLNLKSPDMNAPDTSAYAKEALNIKLKLSEIYFRHPPSKRVNFVKLGITSPFFCEWKILMKQWTDTDDFYVLRNRKLSTVLQEGISSVKEQLLGKNKNTRRNNKRKLTVRPPKVPFDENVFEDKNCLVPIKVSIERKGYPKDFAIICIPTKDDLKTFKDNEKWSGPVQKIKSDPNEIKRKTLRKKHLVLLKRLRKQRVRSRKKEEMNRSEQRNKGVININLRKIITKSLRKRSANVNQNIIEKHAQEMADLYLPKCTDVRNSCDREVMGYITQGDFSFTESKGIGIGYVALQSLFVLIERGTDFVLIRNTKTRQYRIARIEVLLL